MDGKDLRYALGVMTGRVLDWRRDARTARHMRRFLREGAPWIRHCSIQALGVSFRTTVGSPTRDLALKVYVDEKIPRRRLTAPVPGVLRLPGLDGPVPVDVEAVGRLSRQSGPVQGGEEIFNDRTSDISGRLACLLRDKRQVGRYFLLSNAHVLAAGTDVAANDSVLASDGEKIAELTDWLPRTRTGANRIRIDAAIAEIVPGKVLPTLENDRLATGYHNSISVGQRIRLRSLAGRASRVLDDNFMIPEELHPDTRLDDTIAGLRFAEFVRCAHFTEKGDSGSVVLNEHGGIIGLHALGSRTVSAFCRMKNVVDAFAARGFDLEPVTVRNIRHFEEENEGLPGNLDQLDALDDMLAASPSALRDVGRPPVGNVSRAVDILARTIWGEVRGEPRRGRLAVAEVVLNRTRQRSMTVEDVCLQHRQFSCWNAGDPNLPKLRSVTDRDAVFRECVEIAENAVSGFAGNLTRGATHYHVLGLDVSWSRNKIPCAEIGNHVFFNDID